VLIKRSSYQSIECKYSLCAVPQCGTTGTVRCPVPQSCTVRRATDVNQSASYNVQLRRLCHTQVCAAGLRAVPDSVPCSDPPVMRVIVPIHQCCTPPGVVVNLAVDSSMQARRLTVLRSDSSARVAPK